MRFKCLGLRVCSGLGAFQGLWFAFWCFGPSLVLICAMRQMSGQSPDLNPKGPCTQMVYT